MISDQAKAMAGGIYKAYGTDTGYLFGIEPRHKAAVETIIDLVLEMLKRKEQFTREER